MKIINNTIALAGSWSTTIVTAFSSEIGLSLETLGNIDLLSLISGVAAAFLTFSLGKVRLGNAAIKHAEASIKEAEARKLDAETELMRAQIESIKKIENDEDAN